MICYRNTHLLWNWFCSKTGLIFVWPMCLAIPPMRPTVAHLLILMFPCLHPLIFPFFLFYNFFYFPLPLFIGSLLSPYYVCCWSYLPKIQVVVGYYCDCYYLCSSSDFILAFWLLLFLSLFWSLYVPLLAIIVQNDHIFTYFLYVKMLINMYAHTLKHTSSLFGFKPIYVNVKCSLNYFCSYWWWVCVMSSIL